MVDVKEHVGALAQTTGLAAKAGVADFVAFRADESKREYSTKNEARPA